MAAVDRIWNYRFPTLPREHTFDNGRGMAESWAIGAREALAPLRDLHRKTKNTGHCQNKECPCFKPEWVCSCGEWHRDYEPTHWPCETAKLIYPSEEL